MSYFEAKKDNIPMKTDKRNYIWYYPPCQICGTSIPRWSYISGTKYVCKDCREIMVREKLSMTTNKKQKKLETAIKRISKVSEILEYEEAIKTVSNKLKIPRWFQSTEEIMVALELVRRKIIVNHQVKVYDYCVDFVIPEFKVVLEIDGKPFHAYKNKSKKIFRDEIIKYKFGEDWEVIHIETDNINKNVTKLVPTIKAVLKSRKRTL